MQNTTLMKNTALLLALVFFASCQSQMSNSDSFFDEDIPVKVVQASINFSSPTSYDNWYSEISELKEFENYEEENGILLGKKHSVGTYVNTKKPQEKIIILEEIRHLSNGEANFRKLDQLTINLKNDQFLSTSFCSKEDYDDIPSLALYHGNGPSLRRKNIIKAWEIQLDNFLLESISVKNIQCFDEF
jgi:hypothetical protein